MFCPHCGNEISENTKFCSSCGKAASSQKSNLPQPSKKDSANRGKAAIIIGVLCCIVILTAGGIGIAYTMNRNSPKTAVASLKNYIENGDYIYLKDHLLFTSNDIISKDMAKAFVHYLNNDRGNMQEFISLLSINNYSNVIGKGNFFKKEYTYYIEPSYIKATANAANTKIFLDGELKSTTKAASESSNIGPLLPMQYQITAKNTTWKADVTEDINFMETAKTNIPVELNGKKKEPVKTPAPTKAPEPPTKTIIIREPSVSVPVYYANTDYILPNSDSILYTTDYLSSMDKETLRYARNEIYARYGRTFKDDSLQLYFNSKGWYYPTSYYSDTNTDPELNSVEKKNIDRIKAVEAKK